MKSYPFSSLYQERHGFRTWIPKDKVKKHTEWLHDKIPSSYFDLTLLNLKSYLDILSSTNKVVSDLNQMDPIFLQAART